MSINLIMDYLFIFFCSLFLPSHNRILPLLLLLIMACSFIILKSSFFVPFTISVVICICCPLPFNIHCCFFYFKRLTLHWKNGLQTMNKCQAYVVKNLRKCSGNNQNNPSKFMKRKRNLNLYFQFS